MEHGKISESILEAACLNIFGEDFVFKSPDLVSETGKKQELTDMLVVLGKYLITIQSKSIALNTSELDDIKYGRVVNKYEDGKRQINRTLNAFNRKGKVVLKTCFNKHLILPWENIQEIIGIITLNIDDPEYLESEKRFQFPLKVIKHKNITLHTFILRDFYTLINELTTGGDFINYLHERSYLSTKTLHNYTNELDIVAIFVSQYNMIETIHENEFDTIIIEPGIWEEYLKKNKEIIKQRNQKKFQISIIDLIIKEMRLSIDYTMEQQGIDVYETTKRYFFIIGHFGLLSRVQSYFISEKFREKLLTTDTVFLRYFIFPYNDIAIFFLICNETDREVRNNMLIGFTGHVAKYITTNYEHSKLKNILSIVTEGKQLNGRSIDIIYTSTKDALNFVKHDTSIELFRNVDFGSVDEWTM